MSFLPRSRNSGPPEPWADAGRAGANSKLEVNTWRLAERLWLVTNSSCTSSPTIRYCRLLYYLVSVFSDIEYHFMHSIHVGHSKKGHNLMLCRILWLALFAKVVFANPGRHFSDFARTDWGEKQVTCTWQTWQTHRLLKGGSLLSISSSTSHLPTASYYSIAYPIISYPHITHIPSTLREAGNNS